MSFTSGPFNYNRFDIYEGKAKPDYLDFDKDGDKKEPMKKALKEKGKKNIEEKKELPDFIKKKMDEKKGGKCPKCGKDPCECDKKEVKEANMAGAPSIKNAKVPTSTPVKYDKKMNLMAPTIKKEGKDYGAAGRARAERDSGVQFGSYGGNTKLNSKDQKKVNDYVAKKRLQKEESEPQITKEDVIAFMMHEGMANNEVSAEAIFNHISDEYLESIEAAMMGD